MSGRRAQFPRANLSRILGGLGLGLAIALLIHVAPPGLDTTRHWLGDVSDAIVDVLDPLLAPCKALIEAAVQAMVDGLAWLSPIGLTLFATGLALLISGYRVAGLCFSTLIYFQISGTWQSALETFVLMAVSVTLALGIGIPLGIAMALNSSIRRLVRPLLETMQILPAFVYFVPLIMIFGLGQSPAIVATVIYAIAPAACLTCLGISLTDRTILEAAVSAGSTPYQILVKVRIPLAMSSILAGVNQAVMMGLSMVIFVALIGASGLGRDVWAAMRQLDIGLALEIGIAVVLQAILIDRFLSAVGAGLTMPRRVHLVAGLALVTLGVGLGSAGLGDVVQLDPLKSALEDVAGKLRTFAAFAAPFSDGLRYIVIIYGLNTASAFLEHLPITMAVIAVAGIALFRFGMVSGVLTAFGLWFVAFAGLWPSMIQSLAQVAVALVLCAAVGISLGIWAGSSRRVEAGLRPILDTMQTLPAFVYFPIIVMYLKVGVVSGIVATIIYAMPPVIKLTALGLREVDAETVEASRMSGATPLQLLQTVRLPLAWPKIAAGLNQAVILCFSMIAYAALIGAPGLGADVLRAVGRFDIGGGLEAGAAIVIIAIIVDRLTSAAPLQDLSS